MNYRGLIFVFSKKAIDNVVLKVCPSSHKILRYFVLCNFQCSVYYRLFRTSIKLSASARENQHFKFRIDTGRPTFHLKDCHPCYLAILIDTRNDKRLERQNISFISFHLIYFYITQSIFISFNLYLTSIFIRNSFYCKFYTIQLKIH